MQINRYVYQGQDVTHDIHYSVEGRICRYGADDEPKPRLKQAYRDMNSVACDLAGFAVSIHKFEFSHKEGEHLCTMIGLASATNGEIMKIQLPKIGWRSGYKENEVGELMQVSFPIGTDGTGVECIVELMAALEDYVKYGSGQLTLEFEDLEKEVDAVLEKSDRIIKFANQS